VAGKTGTAEKKPDDDYALFMGYAPADANGVPEIAVVAIIEQGGHGSSIAAPVVRRVLEAYFHTESGGTSVIPVTE
jgi:penicillin-binding protein 2